MSEPGFSNTVLLLVFLLGVIMGYQIPFGYWEWRRASKILRRKLRRAFKQEAR